MPDAALIELAHLDHGKQGGGFRILMINDNVAITPREEECFIQLWESGASIWKIAEKMGRTEKVLVILAYELAEEQKIEPRPGGLWGNEWEKREEVVKP